MIPLSTMIAAGRDVAGEAPLAAAAPWPQSVRTLLQWFEHACDSGPGRVAVVGGA